MPTPRTGRRRLLRLAAAGLGVAALGGGTTAGLLYAAARTDTVGEIDFTNPLRVPALELGQTDDTGDRVFDLHLRAGETAIRPGKATRTWGINGDHLGPTLRASRGDTVRVNVRNSLGEESSLHWHGMHLPAASDGGPHQPVAAGSTWTTQWTIDQPAASLWYHPHPHGDTARHVYRGLAGMFIVDDETEAAVDLPREYGVDDIPLIVQDRDFDDDNQLDETASPLSGVGILGDDILVNGTHSPYREVTTQRVRLRLLNGSNARVYRFAFSDDRPFALVATDGGLLAAPHRTRRLQLSPGERAEIVVGFTEGETVVLRSEPPDLGGDLVDTRVHGGDDRFDILQFRAAARLAPSPPVPSTLVTVPRPDPDDAVETRRFRMSGVSLNGETMDMSRIDFAVRRDTVEIWEIENGDASVHNFHIHDVQFQVLDVGGRPPSPELAGRKDTVPVFYGAPVRLVVRFADYADPDMPYMCHCHILYHEDSGLMGQFVVLDDGQRVGTPPTGDDHQH